MSTNFANFKIYFSCASVVSYLFWWKLFLPFGCRAVKDMDYVIHMAGPFPSVEPEDEAEVLNPTVQGTLSVLRACAQTRTVKRVVLTSSVFAVNGKEFDSSPRLKNSPRWQ